ncbi:MAG TPA: cytochrome c biogenesis protein ResB [Anaeromyxobacter sp.]
MTRRALQRLGSLTLTAWILAALGAMFLAGLWIPQKALFEGRAAYDRWMAGSPILAPLLDAAGLTDVHRSPLAVLLWSLFFVNLVAALVLRVPGIVKRARLATPIPAPAASGFPFLRRLPVATTVADPLAVVRARLEARGFLVREGEGRLRAVRNRFAPLATILFHVSFLVILTGALIAQLTRFEGRLELGVGEEFTGDLGQLAGRPVLARFATRPRGGFILENVSPEIVNGTAVRIRVVLRDARGLSREFELNEPYRAEDGTSYVLNDVDVAPLLVVHDAQGQELDGAYLRERLLSGKPADAPIRGLPLKVRLFPDWEQVDGEDTTRSEEMKNPAVQLSIDTKTGRTVRRTLRVGDSALFGPYRVEFREWRYWVGLRVRSERGLPVLFGGFGLAALALALRLLLYRRDYLAALVGGEVELAGRADYYEALFRDEFEATAGDLASALAPSAPGDPPGGEVEVDPPAP